MANDRINKHSVHSNFPPNKYQLNDVKITLTRHAGVIKGSQREKIIFSGNGHSTIELKGKEQAFNYSSKELLSLINSLYKIRFFDLPKRYNIRYSVFLNDDGSVGTNALKMADTSNTTVCFTLPSFEKCVTYDSNKPKELESLIKSVFQNTELSFVD